MTNNAMSGDGREGSLPDRPLEVTAERLVEVHTWRTWREAFVVVTRPQHLRRTVTIALVVGTILFGINQLDVVLRGDADAVTWIKAAVTYVVPFCVSSAGLLVGTHLRSPPPADRPQHRWPVHHRRHG